MNSIRPYPTRSARKIAPTGTIRPTGMTSFSQRKGPMSGAASQPGCRVSMRIPTISPTTLSAEKIVLVRLSRHEPVTHGRTLLT